MLNVKSIRRDLIRLVKLNEFVKDKTGQKVVEIINASFIADEPYILVPPNDDYIRRELDWYKSRSLNVNDIEGHTPVIWQQVASKEGLINSNYGWCIYSEENGKQYCNALSAMVKDINTRRSIMIYTRPSMQQDYNKDGMSDFMCTNTVQYIQRHKQIHAIVNMRSNDAVFGYNNDYAWQRHVLEQFVKDLNHKRPALEGLPTFVPGQIYWNVGSLHLYERHFEHAK